MINVNNSVTKRNRLDIAKKPAMLMDWPILGR